MILYLIKSTACLAILLAIYHNFLEREKMYVFNRFYLLFGLCFSLLIPLFQIEIAPQVLSLPDHQALQDSIVLPTEANLKNTSPEEKNTSFLHLALFVYIPACLLLCLRFARNLYGLLNIIKRNRKTFYRKAILVSLSDKVLPYTFLNYIFIHQEIYSKAGINPHLLTHEYAHVRQKHTLDILFTEFLLIFLWFHPLLYFYQRAIKVNHEFLADEAVLRSYPDVPAYQQILLQQICTGNFFSLASSLNYSLTKKRFTMMSQNKSQTRTILKIAALVPMLFMLSYIFIEKTYAQQENKKAEVKSQEPKEESKKIPEEDSLQIIKDRYYGNSTVRFGSTNAEGERIFKTYDELTQVEKDKLLPPLLSYGKNIPTQEQLDAFLEPSEYGVWIDGKRVENTVLKNYRATDFGNVFISGLEKNAKHYGKYDYHVSLDTHEHLKSLNSQLLERLGIDKKTMKLKR